MHLQGHGISQAGSSWNVTDRPGLNGSPCGIHERQSDAGAAQGPNIMVCPICLPCLQSCMFIYQQRLLQLSVLPRDSVSPTGYV